MIFKKACKLLAMHIISRKIYLQSEQHGFCNWKMVPGSNSLRSSVDEMKTWNYEFNMDSEDNLFNMTSEDNWKLCKPIFSQNICVNCDSVSLLISILSHGCNVLWWSGWPVVTLDALMLLCFLSSLHLLLSIEKWLPEPKLNSFYSRSRFRNQLHEQNICLVYHSKIKVYLLCL